VLPRESALSAHAVMVTNTDLDHIRVRRPGTDGRRELIAILRLVLGDDMGRDAAGAGERTAVGLGFAIVELIDLVPVLEVAEEPLGADRLAPIRCTRPPARPARNTR
jgi:hypothetical protein